MTVVRAFARCSLVLSVLAVTAPRAWAQAAPEGMRREAVPLFDSAVRHFKDGDHARAIREFEAAYAIDPHPALVYALGQVHRVRGDCKTAIRYFREFLVRSPNERQAEAARRNLDRCGAGERPGSSVPSASGPASEAMLLGVAGPAAGADPAVRIAPSEDRLSNRLWLSSGLIAGGLAAAAAGLALWKTGRDLVDEARSAPTYAAFSDRKHDADGGETRQQVGVAMLAVGGSLVAAGVTHFVLRRHSARRAAIAAVPGVMGLTLAAAGCF
jgi:tetratricopeptide (TPR) repeat protein